MKHLLILLTSLVSAGASAAQLDDSFCADLLEVRRTPGDSAAFRVTSVDGLTWVIDQAGLAREMPLDATGRAYVLEHGRAAIDAFISFADVGDALVVRAPRFIASVKMTRAGPSIILPRNASSHQIIGRVRAFGHALEVDATTESNRITCRARDAFAAAELLRASLDKIMDDLPAPPDRFDPIPTRGLPAPRPRSRRRRLI